MSGFSRRAQILFRFEGMRWLTLARDYNLPWGAVGFLAVLQTSCAKPNDNPG